MSEHGPCLTFSLDDGLKPTLDSTQPILTEMGLRASYNLIVGRVGETGHGSWDDWREVADEGMEIASHSLAHPFFPSSLHGEVEWLRETINLSNQMESKSKGAFWKHTAYLLLAARRVRKHQLLTEVVRSKQIIEKRISNNVESFVYPYGRYTEDLKRLISSAGYSTARSTTAGLNTFQNLEPYALKAMTWLSSTTVKEANRWVQEAIKKRAWLIEVLHLVGEIRPKDHPLFTSIERFKKHIQYVVEQPITIDTQRGFIRYWAKGFAKALPSSDSGDQT